MTNLPDPFFAACRALRAGCLATLVLLLAACGPGSGGTGTGPERLLLAFSGTAGALAPPGQVTLPTAGTAGCADCDRVDLQLQPEVVELTAACGRFVADTAWQADASNLAIVAGRFEPTTGAAVAATLRLQFSALPQASQSVTATVVDAAGRTRVGPATLARQEMLAPRPAAAAVACP